MQSLVYKDFLKCLSFSSILLYFSSFILLFFCPKTQSNICLLHTKNKQAKILLFNNVIINFANNTHKNLAQDKKWQ